MSRSFGSPRRYNPLAKWFHWVSALIVLGLLPLGFYMTTLDFGRLQLNLYAWHKSFGTLLLFIVGLRILWRLSKGTPRPLETHAAWEIGLAKLVHILLYIGLIGMPVSGWLMTSYGAFPHAFFGFNIPPVTGESKDMFRLMRNIHGIFAYSLIGAILLHAAGALKHHVIDKDITLKRMLPDAMPRIGAVLAVFVLSLSMILSGVFYVKHLVSHDHSHDSGIVEELGKIEGVDTTAYVHEGGSEHVHEAPKEVVQKNVQTWVIDRSASEIGFTAVTQGAEFSGLFKGFDGTIVFDPGNLPESRVDISVNIGSVSTGSEERDGYMMDKAWLYQEKYPLARFESDNFAAAGEGRYEASGLLTMRGVSLPVTFPFALDITESDDGRKKAFAKGVFAINRLDYKIGDGDWSDGQTASHEIKITVAITATAE